MTHNISKILLVDDDEFFLRVFQRILTRADFLTVTAASLAEAREKFRTELPDAVLIDLRLPDGSGVDLVREVHARNPEVPILVLTAYGEVDSYMEAMNGGACDYLDKPIASDQLIATLHRYLERPRHSSWAPRAG